MYITLDELCSVLIVLLETISAVIAAIALVYAMTKKK